ncbi:hypothetical protein HDU83_000990 [Entophlyctis luteolus]|nr:hypothetical protein HDU83_000990 [Entophlyctis luteolus]
MMFQLLMASTAAQPYPLTIRQGFHFKYRLRTKYQIKCVIIHSRLPFHTYETRATDNSDQIPDPGESTVRFEAESELKKYAERKMSGPAGADQQTSSAHNSMDAINAQIEENKLYSYDGDGYEKRVPRYALEKRRLPSDWKINSLRIWDLSRKVQPKKPALVVKLDRDVHDLVYMPKFSLYAACNESKSVTVCKLFSKRFSVIDTIEVGHHVQ